MRFNVLDIMRFTAAISVVFYHYTAGDSSAGYGLISEITKFGYLGVPLFFMISGFVISASALNRTPLEFGISRATRLYPTVFACLTLTVLTIQTLGDGSVSLFQYLTNLTILNGYVGQSYIDGVYWTLLAELKFYFCIFLLLMFGVFEKFKVWLSIWMLMTISFLLIGQPFFMGAFISPEYSAFFIAGVAFFLVTKHGYDKFYTGLLGTALVVGSIRAYEQASGFMVNADQIAHMISLILVWSFFLLFTMISLDKIKLKDSKLLMLLGGMTYPLYLLHSKIGAILYEQLGDTFNPYTLLILITSLMLFLAYLIHVTVERKLANRIKKYLLQKLNTFNGVVDKAS